MNSNEKRQLLCARCIIVSSFDSLADLSAITNIFPELEDGQPVTPAGIPTSSSRLWIIKFRTNKDAEKYVHQRTLRTPEGEVHISPCECPCDIPEEWVLTQDDTSGVGVVPTGHSNHVVTEPFKANEDLLQALTNMGFDKDVSIQGLQYTGNYSADAAVEWILTKDTNIQTPYQPPSDIYPHQMPFPYNAQGFPRPVYPGYMPPFPSQWQIQIPAYPQFQQMPSFPEKVPFPNKDKTDTSRTSTNQKEDGGFKPIEVHTSRKIERPDSSKATTEGAKKISQQMETIHIREKSRMLKVTNLSPNTTEDNLTFFFENTRRSGGGEVESVDFDPDTLTAIITFENAESVEKVLSKRPLQFMKGEIRIEVYAPNSRKSRLTDIESTTKETTPVQPERPSCVIEVHGIKPTTQEITIQYYFEGKKGANEDIKDIEYVDKRNVYLITFDTEEAVEKVLERTHKIDGALLDVRRYVPPQRYPNKVVVHGISSRVTEDGLINYFEGRTKIDVDNVDYSETDPETAVITFCQDIDVKDIQAACSTKSLETVHLEVKPVFVSNCIVVTEFGENTTENSLEYYFDNKRKSGVEQVKEVVMENGYCLVYFEDPEDAEKACQRQHEIDHCQLKVKVYHDCLGPPKIKHEAIKSDIELPPVFIDDMDETKLKFLLRSETMKDVFSKEMEKVYSKIIWPSSYSGSIKLECCLSKENSDFVSISKSWDVTAKQTLEKLLLDIEVKRYFTLRDTWEKVVQELSRQHLEETNLIQIFYEAEPCEIYIVGQKISVDPMSLKLDGIIKDITESLQKENERVIDEIGLEKYQMTILSQTGLLQDIADRYTDLKIETVERDNKVGFKGLPIDVNAAKIDIYAKLANVKPSIVGPVSTHYLTFLQKPDVKRLMDDEIESCRYVGAWVLGTDTINIYAFSANDSANIAGLFKTSISEVTVKVEDSNKSLLNSREFSTLIKNIELDCRTRDLPVLIHVNDEGEIGIICTSKMMSTSIREQLQDFMFDNSSREQVIRFSKLQMAYILKNHRDKIDNLIFELNKKHITISFKEESIVVTGNRKGIKYAMQEIDPLVKIMQAHAKPEDVKPVAPYGLGVGSVIASFTAESGQIIMVLCCDISLLDVDIIVSPADPHLSNNGGLSRQIADEGGLELQRECRDYQVLHGQLNEGEIYCSCPGNLKCKVVIHAVGPTWQNLQSNEDTIMRNCVFSILREMEKRQLHTIAIPALATGTSQYPVDEATSTIVKAIRQYLKKKPESCIKTVYLCDIAAKKADFFVIATRGAFKGSDKKAYIPDAARGIQSVSHPVPQVKIKIQDLAYTQVDVIVNTTSQDLQLSKSGAVSASLVKVGGISIQQECQLRYRNGIQFGNIAVTSSGNLQCKQVFHGALPPWNRNGSSLKILKQFVTICLQTVVNSYRYTSIAFPSLGTGKLDYPPGEVAREMYNAVAEHFQSYPQSSLQDVFFVLYHKDYSTVTAFQDEEMRRRPKQHSRRKDRL